MDLYDYLINIQLEYEATKKRTTVAKIIIYLCIFVLGILANLFVIVVIVRLKEYRKAPFQWYILQLAVADTLLIMSIPFQLSEDLNDEWIYPVWMCKAKEAILFINYYASISLLTVMSVSRYIAICHPLSSLQRKLKEPKYMISIGLLIWGISILLTLPVMLYTTTKGEEPHCKCQNTFPNEVNPQEICLREEVINTTGYLNCLKTVLQEPNPHCRNRQSHDDFNTDYHDYQGNLSLGDYAFGNFSDEDYGHYNANEAPEANFSGSKSDIAYLLFPECHYIDHPFFWKVFVVYNFILFFSIPVLVMSVCYGLIAKKLRQPFPSSNFNQSSEHRSHHISKERRRVTITCVALVSSFIICWLPFHAVHLAKLANIKLKKPNLCHILSIVGIMLVYLNSAVNPYLYTFISKGFCQRLDSLKTTTEVQWILKMIRDNRRRKQSTTQQLPTLESNTASKNQSQQRHQMFQHNGGTAE